MSELLTADKILAANDHEVERVEVPEWKGHVFLRTLSEREYITWISDGKEEGKDPSILLLQRTLCDKDGKNLLTEEQVAALADKSVHVINRLVERALQINGMNLKEEEELVGKLESRKSGSRTG